MLLVVENANTDLPPIGFCIDWLLGFKYDGLPLSRVGFFCRVGASGGIWTRDHYLTKVTPHRARLPRRAYAVPVKELLLANKMLTVD
jgi:hypothetical protein